MGGLAFTYADSPISDGTSIWINTLLVVPNYRSKGIAGSLISEAEAIAAAANIPMLFVYSGVPIVYKNLGWMIVNTSEENTVLSKRLLP